MYKRYDFKSFLGKTLEAFFGFLFIYPLSYLTKRNNRIWVFGSHVKFSGNPKYLFLYVHEEINSIRPIWISGDKSLVKDLSNKKYEAYYKWSMKGLYYSLIAGVYFFSFYTVDINYFAVGRALDFNLWHGIGIKLIEFNVKHGEAAKHYNPNNLISRIYAPFLFRRPQYLLSTSKFTTDYLLKDAFRISENKCIELGYPRTDLFFSSLDTVKQFVKLHENQKTFELIEKIQKYSFSYIYMPTWRETRYDFITSAGFDFALLNEQLIKTNSVFILKLHHATKLDTSSIANYSNIFVLDNKIDVYVILPFITTLITDYSSIYHDFMLLDNKQIILFPFDKEDYISENRGITLDPRLDYDEYTLGQRAYSFEELLSLIKNNNSMECYSYPQREKMKKIFWGNYTGSSSKQIVDFVFDKLCIKK